MARPLIGITSELAAAGWRDRVREAVLLPASYAVALDLAGCVPVLLPPAPHGAGGLVARLDAVLFSDGRGIDPRRCGGDPDDQAADPDLARDAGEFAMMRAAIDARLPVLAIGRGMHVLNAVRGGTVVERPQPATADANGSAKPAAREIRISPDSRLGRVLGPGASVPGDGVAPADGRQAVDALGSGLSAVAWAADEIVFAVELARYPFAIGMQWHPEETEDLRIFEALREAAAARHREAA